MIAADWMVTKALARWHVYIFVIEAKVLFKLLPFHESKELTPVVVGSDNVAENTRLTTVRLPSAFLCIFLKGEAVITLSTELRQ